MASRDREKLCAKKHLMGVYFHANISTDGSLSEVNVRLGTAIMVAVLALGELGFEFTAS